MDGGGTADADRTLAGKPALITSDDWNALQWDPGVLRDIERRRGANADQKGVEQQRLTDGS